MDFLIRLAKAGTIFVIAVFLLAKSGLNSDDAKFQVISLLVFWGVVFFFLHPYMASIAQLEIGPYAEIKDSDERGVVWKFLAVILFFIATICFFAW